MTTTSGRSPESGFSPQRRSLLLGGIGGASTAALALGGGGTAAASQSTGSTAQSAAQPPEFDWDNGNFLSDFRDVDAMGAGDIAPMDVTPLIRINDLMTHSWFDAVAPYHPTAVGIYTRIERRPASEGETNRNRNIAVIYATYRVVQGVFEEREPLLREVLVSLGLDPDDESEDPTTAIGIGNMAGKGVINARLGDGINQLGDEGPKYNGRPYEDYTGYRPVNTAFEVVNPSRWQPQLGPHNRRQGVGQGDKGAFAVQHFVTPQLRLTESHTFDDPSEFELPPPRFTDHTRERDYKRSVDEILEVSANLTDEQKVIAELFDNKVVGIRLPIFAAGDAHPGLDMDGWVQVFLMHTVAMYDSLIAVWHNKVLHDAVRPWTAVQHVYGDRPVRSWGGVGMGTVNDMPADEWASYLKVGDHAEYPSGSTTIASAEAQATRRFFGDDKLDWSYAVEAGGAVVEPGVTPARDIELRWETWTEFVEDFGYSRVWGGVHFSKTVERSMEFGKQFGDMAYDYVTRYVNGDVED
ncbi:DUF6851 domain-containing protein [Streptomyces sp. SBT349]|uniref:DUF6851 domain-containing protein n=1 Tax=Streptomyces sp. SBT349 TaxID=1580539 RepID=UPI000A81500E|nr:hypothetical protein [Streptomyces sp. SBT349]